MNDNPNIAPESGQDRNLAQAYGELLRGGRTSGSIRDPLFDLLSSTKEELNREESSIGIQGKEFAWEQLYTAISESSSDGNISEKGRILPFNTGSRWFKAAAAILLIAVSTLITLTLTSESGPELLASAGSEIEVLELTDGSVVTLRPNSSIYEVSRSEDRHLYKLEGEALFSVVSNSEREFTVRADRGEVTVLGTRFNLYERNDKVRVDLIEGSVRFTNLESQDNVVLEPGEAAEITQQQSMNGPLTASGSNAVTSWTQNRLEFRNRALSDILNELEFHYDIRIDVPAPLENERMGGSIMLDSKDRALRDLGIVLGGIFIEKENGQFEFEEN